MEEARSWRGRWIWHSGQAGQGNEMVLFRRAFTAPAGCAELRLYVSADSRYRLFINGESVGIGPCK